MNRRISKLLFTGIFIFIFIIYLSSPNHINHIYDVLREDSTTISKNSNNIEPEVYTTNNFKLLSNLEIALLNGDDEIVFPDLSIFNDPKEIFKTLEELSNQNPEIMYYKGAEYKFGHLSLLYSKDKEDIIYHREEIRNKREEFISNYINSNMSDYEKALIIHDYIIENGRYDERLTEVGYIPAESYSTYGILVLGVGVCESYAKAMKYLLDAVDLESFIVIGESKNENHAWNLVKLDGEYYHIDPTWDDPITSDGNDITRYNYFNLTDEDISKTHHWDREKYPPALGERYNYFKYNNLIVEGKDEVEVRLRDSLLKRQSKLSIKVKDFHIENIVINEMIENYVYENNHVIGLKSYSYSIDEDHKIMDFNFYYH